MLFYEFISPAILIFAALLLPLAVSDCTRWTDSRWLSDGTNGYSTSNFHFLDNLVCPSQNKTGCTIPRKTYQLTIKRTLNITTDGADADNIFTLAQNNYGPGRNYTAPPFITRSTTVSSTGISDIFLKVEPGMNKTLGWIPFMLYSYGNLGNCTNATLNDVGVMAAAPYLMNDTNDNSVVAGAWSAFSNNITSSGAGSSAFRLSGSFVGFLSAIAVAMLCPTVL
jgi:hypothetical protein